LGDVSRPYLDEFTKCLAYDGLWRMSNGTRSDNNAACTPVANPVSTLLLVLNDPDAVAQINAHDLVGLGGHFDTPIIGAARHRPKISFICLLFIYTIASTMEYTALNCFRDGGRRKKIRILNTVAESATCTTGTSKRPSVVDIMTLLRQGRFDPGWAVQWCDE
jgi:hypothetical protein